MLLGESDVAVRVYEAILISTWLGHHTKLPVMQAPLFGEEKRKVGLISYGIRVGSIKYGMVCSMSNLEYMIKIVSQFLANKVKCI